MREIKFRAKTNGTDEWIYGDLLSHRNKSPKNGKFIGVIATIPTKYYEIHRVKINTIGQFTGLKDKNGKEIYEGDIFEVEGEGYFVVQWSGAGYFELQFYGYYEKCLDGNAYETVWDKLDCEPIWNWDIEKMEIKGNIYDNPKLLEVKE